LVRPHPVGPFVEENYAIADLTRDERLADPAYYKGVVEPALEKAKTPSRWRDWTRCERRVCC
jgi:hypothetical protein